MIESLQTTSDELNEQNMELRQQIESLEEQQKEVAGNHGRQYEREMAQAIQQHFEREVAPR